MKCTWSTNSNAPAPAKANALRASPAVAARTAVPRLASSVRTQCPLEPDARYGRVVFAPTLHNFRVYARSDFCEAGLVHREERRVVERPLVLERSSAYQRLASLECVTASQFRWTS